jgi:L-seryl-tRNA(Ser) seleniumtransferase
MDKASIAALNATLLHYVKGDATSAVPVWRMISTPEATLRRRALRLSKAAGHGAEVIRGRSMVGGGSLPEESLPAHLVALPPQAGLGVDDVARRLRLGTPAVVGRIEHDRLLLDPRTIDPRDDAKVSAALLRALV